MFNLYICNNDKIMYDSNINNEIYNIKLSNNYHKPLLIKKYNLINISKIKEYWLNNVLVTSDKIKQHFEYIIDINISYNKDNNHIFHEYETKSCENFQFYEVDIEEEYSLYTNKINGVEIILKEYYDYCTLTFKTDELNNYKNIDIFYI